MVDGAVHVVARRERGRAHVELGAAVDRALAHLRVEERDAGALDEARQLVDQARAVAGRADHDQRPLRLRDHRRGALDRGAAARPATRPHAAARSARRRPRRRRRLPAARGAPDRAAPPAPRGTHRGRASGMLRGLTICRAILVSGFIDAIDVDDLEPGLLGRHDRLLPGEQDHRHRAELRVRGAGREVERARAERGDADAGAAGEPAMRGRHEGGGLLVAREHQLDARLPQRLDDVEVLLAGHAEDAVDAFVRERRDQQIRTFAHACFPERRPDRSVPASPGTAVGRTSRRLTAARRPAAGAGVSPAARRRCGCREASG